MADVARRGLSSVRGDLIGNSYEPQRTQMNGDPKIHPSELSLPQSPDDHLKVNRAAVIAGTSVSRHLARFMYAGWGADKVFGLPGLGLGALEGTYRDLTPPLAVWAHKNGPVKLIGHSQGALHAYRFALDFPHLVDKVVCVGGPFLGSGLASSVVKVGCVAGMADDSLWLRNLRTRSLEEPPVDLTLIAGSKDLLVEADSAFGLPAPAKRAIVDCGHVALMFDPTVSRLVRL